MFISVRQMEQGEVRFDRTFDPNQIDLSGSQFQQAGALRATGVAVINASTGEIRVRGHIDGQLTAECDRCLETTALPLDGDFELVYRPSSTDNALAEKEIDASESEVGYYEDGGLELGEVLREQILLWLPMHWVCNTECRGICPICGENRNLKDCGCQEQDQDDRWAALKGFRPSATE